MPNMHDKQKGVKNGINKYFAKTAIKKEVIDAIVDQVKRGELIYPTAKKSPLVYVHPALVAAVSVGCSAQRRRRRSRRQLLRVRRARSNKLHRYS